MDIKEYIASGIVELYAMNALSPDEKKEFERMKLLYPEIGAELTNVEMSLEKYTVAHSVNPRPQLRHQLMDKINQNGNTNVAKPKNKSNGENHTLTYKYLIAASLAALVISTFASWFFYSRWNEAEERYSSLLNEKNDLAQNYNQVKATLDESVSNLIVLRDENSTIFTLNSTDTANNYQARIYWNKNSHQTYIDVLSLPVPDEGKQFQLWALVKGTPVDAGVFETVDEGIQRVKNVADADSWMVTLEPKGGSETPTMDMALLISKRS